MWAGQRKNWLGRCVCRTSPGSHPTGAAAGSLHLPGQARQCLALNDGRAESLPGVGGCTLAPTPLTSASGRQYRAVVQSRTSESLPRKMQTPCSSACWRRARGGPADVVPQSKVAPHAWAGAAPHARVTCSSMDQMHGCAQVPHRQVQKAATLDLTGERGASAGAPQPAGPAAGAPGNPPGRQLAGPAVAQGVARPD